MLGACYSQHSVPIYLCMFVRRFSPLQSAGQHNCLMPGVAYLKIAHDQAAGVRNIFPIA